MERTDIEVGQAKFAVRHRCRVTPGSTAYTAAGVVGLLAAVLARSALQLRAVPHRLLGVHVVQLQEHMAQELV